MQRNFTDFSCVDHALLAFNVMIHAGEAAAFPFSTRSFLSAAYGSVYRRRTVAGLDLQSKSGHNNTSTLFLMSVLDPRGDPFNFARMCLQPVKRASWAAKRAHSLGGYHSCSPFLSFLSWVSVLAVSQVCGGRHMNKSSVFFLSGNEKSRNHKAWTGTCISMRFWMAAFGI